MNKGQQRRSFKTVKRSFSAMTLAATALIAMPSSGFGQPPEGSVKAGLDLICTEKVEMGTPFKICVYAEPAEKMTVTFDLNKSFRRIRQINDWMSEWQPGTQLSQVNEAAGAHPVKVGADLFELMRFALKVSENTEGAFDPTFNAFWGLYNFKPGQHREPTDAEIKERLPLINYKNVVLDPREKSVFLKQVGMKLGLGGLGQGYAVDAVVKDLKTRYPAGYVDGSGDTYFWGKKPNGALWVTGVRDPRDKSNVALRIYGTDFAITTCGDDEKYFMEGDRRVHHIIDPKTGRSSTASRQVTVISRSALDSDAYDTGSFVLGPDKGKKVIEKLGYRAVFITDKGITLTQGLNKTKTEWGDVYEIQGQLN